MRPLSASDLLELCDLGRGTTPVEQALLLLRFAFPQAAADDLARLTIGQRDACLLRLREMTLGSQLTGLANCPVCHERLEMGFDVHDLGSQQSGWPDFEALPPVSLESAFHMDGYEVIFRPLTSGDLLALPWLTETSLARQQFMDTCLISVHRDGDAAAAADLPSEVFEALIQAMNEADPVANLTLTADCPACGHTWPMIFDIVSYFWSEINAWAGRLLREVHVLASAYGWREADILAMSAWRRHRYLEMVGT